MNTRVFRIDLDAEPSVDKAIAQACDKQLTESFKLASTFVWTGTDHLGNPFNSLILIFQKTT